MQIDGKTAIVTGAGTGVGKATAIKLAELGANVVVHFNRSADAAAQTVADVEQLGRRAIACQADVRSDEQIRAMVAKAVDTFGRLDVLVNNAGTTEFIPADDLDAVTDATWQELLDVNLVGPFRCARAVAPLMRETAGKDGGEIVMVSSVAALLATGSSIPYCASKAALNNMTVSLARSLAPDIRVNAVAPGFIAGDWIRRGLGEHYETTKQVFEQQLPLQRVCQPQDVADAIASLISGSDLVTGQILVCDSGMRIIAPVQVQ
jgi:3-oxoacyl-[acyl-carrier protein] reductase